MADLKPDLTLDRLPMLLATLRAAGVTSFSGYGLTLALGDAPAPAGALPLDGLPSAPDAPALCPCGHSYAVEHSEAGCLRGCSEAQCSSKDAEPEPVE